MLMYVSQRVSMEDIKAAKRLHKQIYNRERLRLKGQMHKEEMATLRKEVEELEKCIEKTKFNKSSALSWQDIAIVFREEKGITEYQNNNLKKQLKAQENIRKSILEWLACESSQYSIQIVPNPSIFTYKYTSLMSDDTTRQMGLTWISKRLYHNLDPWIEQCQLPVSMEPYFRVDVRETDESYVLEEYKQRVEFMPLDHVTRCLEKIYFQHAQDDMIEYHDGNTMRYVRYPSWYGKEQNHSFDEKMLIRAFNEKNRYIVFTHSISNDEKHPQVIYGDWTAWVVAERLTPTCTLIKNGFINYGMRNASRYMNLEEECPFLEGVDETEKFTKFKHYQINYRTSRQAGDLEHFTQVAKEVEIQ